jgi:hypothetical protein
MKTHYDILIATIGTSLSNGYVESLTKTLQELSDREITYKWLNSSGSLDHNARESAVTGNGLVLSPNDKGPLGDNCTYNKLFWINNNISWNFKNFLKLYDASEHVITGAYLQSDGVTSNAKQFTGSYYAKEQITQLKNSNKKVKIATTKFGFIAIKSGIYERIDRPWHVVFPGFETEEDSWCFKVRNVGIDITLDPTVLVSNLIDKEIKWK